MSNYQSSIAAVERAILAQDIFLPATNTDKSISFKELESKGSYKIISAFDVYKDIKAKFYLTILTPLVDKNDVAQKSNGSPLIRGQAKSKLYTSGYTSSNYVELTIPKYILLQFKNKVPKGTEFLICIPGGGMDIDDIRIIGIYSIKEEVQYDQTTTRSRSVDI